MSSVRKWSWVSSKCWILTAGVQGSPQTPLLWGFGTNKAKWASVTLGVLRVQVVLSQVELPKLDYWGPGWPPHTLGVLRVQVVLSQVKLPNLDCWGPGESIDTHIVGVWNKKGKVTSTYPRCPQCPGGPESALNVKSWLLGSRGVHWYPICWVSVKKKIPDFLSGYHFCFVVCFYIRFPQLLFTVNKVKGFPLTPFSPRFYGNARGVAFHWV